MASNGSSLYQAHYGLNSLGNAGDSEQVKIDRHFVVLKKILAALFGFSGCFYVL